MPDHGTTDDHCLEVIVVRGKAAEIEELAKEVLQTCQRENGGAVLLLS